MALTSVWNIVMLYHSRTRKKTGKTVNGTESHMTLPTDGFMGAGASVMCTVVEVSDNDRVFVIQIIGLCNILASL